MLAQVSQTVTYLLETYGLTGVVITFLIFGFWFLIKMHKVERNELHVMHNKERAEWKETDQARFNAILDATTENTGVIRELKGIMNTINGKL